MKSEDTDAINRVDQLFTLCHINLPEDAYNFVENIYYEQNKIKKFIKDNFKLIEQYVSKNNEFDIFKEHPILGDCNGHAYFEIPLYRHVSLTEPQFTKALAQFFNEKQNQKLCQTFIYAIFETLHKRQIIQAINNKIECGYEIPTKDVINPKTKSKRIDNIFIWDNNLLCVEIKFDAQLTNNLEIYQEECQTIAKERNIENIIYIVISKVNIQKQIDKYLEVQGMRDNKWQNILWQDLLRNWEKIIHAQHIDEDTDMKRYRTSLWYKVLNKEA